VSSLAFLDAFGRDPFLVDAPSMVAEPIETAALGEFSLPDSTTRVQLSPDGQFVAALQESEEDDDRAATFHLGRLGEPLKTVAGDVVRFLDDGTALIVESDRDGTTLRQVRLNSTLDVLWRQRVPELQGAGLSLSRNDAWHLQGWDREEAIMRADGVIGAAEFHQRRWPVTYARDAWINAMTTAGPEPLVVETRYDRGLLQRLPARAWMLGLMLHAGTQQSRYWLAGGASARPLGESRLGADCSTGAADGALICSVYDGARTRLLRLDPDDGSVSGIGVFDGHFFAEDDAIGGWLTGWHDASAVAVDLVNRRVVQLPHDDAVAGALSVSGGRLAAVVMDGGNVNLRVYRIPAPQGVEGQRSASAARIPAGR
jgi:hypothetical protein